MAVRTVRTDVDRQLRIDRNYGADQGQLVARMRAVIGAQRAMAQGETGSIHAFRQSLIDLAGSRAFLRSRLPAYGSSGRGAGVLSTTSGPLCVQGPLASRAAARQAP